MSKLFDERALRKNRGQKPDPIFRWFFRQKSEAITSMYMICIDDIINGKILELHEYIWHEHLKERKGLKPHREFSLLEYSQVVRDLLIGDYLEVNTEKLHKAVAQGKVNQLWAEMYNAKSTWSGGTPY